MPIDTSKLDFHDMYFTVYDSGTLDYCAQDKSGVEYDINNARNEGTYAVYVFSHVVHAQRGKPVFKKVSK